MSPTATLNSERLSFGYLLRTREAVMHDRPAAAPLLELGEQAEQLGLRGDLGRRRTAGKTAP